MQFTTDTSMAVECLRGFATQILVSQSLTDSLMVNLAAASRWVFDIVSTFLRPKAIGRILLEVALGAMLYGKIAKK